MRFLHQGRIAKIHCTVINTLSTERFSRFRNKPNAKGKDIAVSGSTEISDWDSIYYQFADEKVESTDSKVDRFRNLR